MNRYVPYGRIYTIQYTMRNESMLRKQKNAKQQKTGTTSGQQTRDKKTRTGCAVYAHFREIRAIRCDVLSIRPSTRASHLLRSMSTQAKEKFDQTVLTTCKPPGFAHAALPHYASCPGFAVTGMLSADPQVMFVDVLHE